MDLSLWERELFPSLVASGRPEELLSADESRPPREARSLVKESASFPASRAFLAKPISLPVVGWRTRKPPPSAPMTRGWRPLSCGMEYYGGSN